MEILILIVSLLFVFVGIAGSVLPALPGPPLSWIGLLILYTMPNIKFDYWILGITFVFTLIIVILDYVIPAQGTKRFGGSKYGIWGTNIGLIVGILAPIPFGFIIGPFVGAFIGELIYDQNDSKRALKAATGSFFGFLASTFIKFVFCMILFGIYIHTVWKYWSVWF
ncbi:hypothetical protein SAMN05421741_101143 [Paenimyroides ummariense]|uniref:DUF456 domain-containing protein n=1 Tax=Paenimyroides ummariense TaxID=913024 RepID=A0A1I4WAB3_9FLAO|nr:DUF456 domain-containing protein [Paenimyroides ummariense]SFN10638.1 hypothetical protein SAMN05421741_101143 [Paenimyroides ummariense]